MELSEDIFHYYFFNEERCHPDQLLLIKDFEAFGDKSTQGVRWKIMVGRYNYSRYLPKQELRMIPQLSKTSFYLYEEYSDLELVR
ncbi:MAG: hypothetical protein A2Y10_17710 [Planctomycetes bacterium GWF2_41_51]|nr:MAG: hypothetical protein A2Y10_17710 [Planctomycetes bacterium GWF2_41_51]